jgi:GR25 family glycosyltransferase involved in LPS biosynthesis
VARPTQQKKKTRIGLDGFGHILFIFLRGRIKTKMITTRLTAVYYINLDDSHARREAIEGMLHRRGLASISKRIAAVDGRGQGPQVEANLRRFFDFDEGDMARRTGNPQYACLASHVQALKTFVADVPAMIPNQESISDDVALILEDDMTDAFLKTTYWQRRGDGTGDVKAQIQFLLSEAPQDWEILQLCYIYNPSVREAPRTYELIALNNPGGLYSTGAYLIRRRAAKRILQLLFIEDQTGEGQQHRRPRRRHPEVIQFPPSITYHEVDHSLYSLVPTYCCPIPLFIYGYDVESTIHPTHLSLHQFSRQMIEKQHHLLFVDKNPTTTTTTTTTPFDLDTATVILFGAAVAMISILSLKMARV